MNDTNTELLVGDITPEHYGWIIHVKDDRLGCLSEREIHLVAHRTWEYQGQQKVGLVSDDSNQKRILGTEYHYSADTPCRLVRQWRKPRRKKSGSKKTA